MEKACARPFADIPLLQAGKKRLSRVTPQIATLSSLLDLAGNEVRLSILFLLSHEKELCVCDLADILLMSIPAVSQHLRKLKDGSLVQCRRKGQTIAYSLAAEKVEILQSLLAGLQTRNG